ncbi:unnamed protein product [Mytilus coruscus]|uniref:Uncharacterized protein n=1 Tax=Mytilus coruscus TaxID=42192 RepID=A0A6J8AIS9_MYTCO|nr:unnamed protein product [Mytilus coruscus]
MEKGKHWDIWFEEIDQMSEVSQEKRLKVIIVLVAEIPGGVLTTVPESFYTDDNGNVLQYTNITQWKHDFIKSYKILAFESDEDVCIIDIKGFTEEEALDFIREGKTLTPDEKEGSCILLRKLSCNPKALHIVRTYITYSRLKIGGIIERLKLPSDILKVEESRAVKSKVKDKMFLLLISLLREIHQNYQEDKKEEIFEMFLMLQYVKVEKIPLAVFSNINVKNSKMDTDDLLYVVENCSFGTV